MHCLGMLLLLLLQSVQSGPPRDMPAEPGVYYRQEDGGWVKLNPAVVAQMRHEGVELFVDTGGYTNLGMKGMLQPSRAAARISASRPTLYVRGVGAPGDVVLIQLKRENDRRVFETSSVDATVENKGGFRKKDMRNTAVVVYSDSSFSVTPEQALKEGEYLLCFGYAQSGFDFGVDLKRRQ